MREPLDPRQEDPTLGVVLRLTGIGWYVGVCIAGGAMLGQWADGRLDTRPALVITGLFVGIAVAFGGMISMLRAVMAAWSRNGLKKDDGQGQ